MKLKDFMDVAVLQKIQNQFSDATGLAAIAVDEEGKYITEGSNFTDFCMKYTRASSEGMKRCVKCDTECTGTYFCHAGLMDFSSDILVNGKKVGAIIGGQVLPSEPNIEKFQQIARELGIDEKRYIEALKKVPIKTEASIRAASGMLGDIINQMVNLQYLEHKDKNKLSVLTTEIKESLSTVASINARTKELESIATRQNILSLNASIEAARSGEAGVGFTVVAKQMGELSKQSAIIYSDIKEKTDNITRSIDKMSKVFL